MRWTRSCRQTCDMDTDSKGVWSWHPWAGAKHAGDDQQATVTKRSWTPGRARRSLLKPLRRECRCFGLTCSDFAGVLLIFAHWAMGAAKRLAFPAPSVSFGGGQRKTRARMCRGNADSHPVILAQRLSAVARRANDANAVRRSPAGDDLKTRSFMLTILWRCDCRPFSSRTAFARGSGKKPSTVLAEHHAAQGSGNADSRPNGWDFGEGGSRSRRRSLGLGCVAAHPAHRRASPSYLPLRADWAACAWALRGRARCQNPSAPI
jgi:hypothetical protein